MRRELDRAELEGWLRDAAKLWLAHDGLWFQAVERALGTEEAIRLDAEAWRRFSPIEARRILARLGREPGGGIPLLVEAIEHRLYALLNRQETIEVTDRRAVFRMLECRVQEARARAGLPDFPCKRVGLVEYGEFARTIDPRLEVRCLTCPPDPPPGGHWCAWEFTLKDA